MGIAAVAIVAGIAAIAASVHSATKRADNRQPNLPMMAEGGVLSSGSAIVGEAGPELLTMQGSRAVVQPLTNNYTTNYNTSSQPILVTLQLDRSVLARELVDPIGQQIQLKGANSVI